MASKPRSKFYFRFETYSPEGVICLSAVIWPFSSTNSMTTSANS